jgi:hypothetical protein
MKEFNKATKLTGIDFNGKSSGTEAQADLRLASRDPRLRLCRWPCLAYDYIVIGDHNG